MRARNQTTHIDEDLFTSARQSAQARHVVQFVQLSAGDRIDRPRARTAIAAWIDITAGIVIGIFDALQKPSRSGRLALRITGEGAVAQTRIFIALDAKGIAGSDGLGRRGAGKGQSARGQQCESEVTHQDLPSAAAASSPILCFANPSRSGGVASTHIRRCQTRPRRVAPNSPVRGSLPTLLPRWCVSLIGARSRGWIMRRERHIFGDGSAECVAGKERPVALIVAKIATLAVLVV